MGKSLGNYIGISESPFEMMKKFMQVPDGVMRMYFELLTDIPLSEIDALLAGHPKTAKTTLARAVIAQYHSTAEAASAANRWQQEVGEGALPTDIPTVPLSRGKLTDGTAQAARLLVDTGLCPTTSDARRAIAQGGAYFGENKTRMETHDQTITVISGLLLFVGKKKFCRVDLTD
jgi:tyrosyl-tRNA synthetase